MQPIVCPLCDSPHSVPAADVCDRLMGVDGSFTLVRCAACGLHYLNPQPTTTEMARYYPEEYDPFSTPLPGELPWVQQKSIDYGLRKRRRAITRYKRAGRLLEVGCANGLFLDSVRRTGEWQVQGVDTSECAVRKARERLGLEVLHGTLEEAQFAAGSFDAVAMWDVLEHVHRPRETLVEVRRVLKPDGVLVVRVPVIDGWDCKLFGRYWAGWDAPRHLTLFSRHTLEAMLARTGFDVLQTVCLSGSHAVFALSARLWAREHLSAQLQRLLKSCLAALPVRVAAAPLFCCVDRLGRCSVVTVVACPHDTGRQTSSAKGSKR